LGLPLVTHEFLIGKLSGKTLYGAFQSLTGSRRWKWLSWMTVATAMLLTSFYFVVTGWCFFYLVQAAMNTFAGMDTDALSNFFYSFEDDPVQVVLYAILAIVLTASVLWFDVNKGIERLSKILMPILFLMLIVMAIHMVFMDGGTKGLLFLFEPDFTKITPKVILDAVGLSFFTLSVGIGILVTYGSYMPKESPQPEHPQADTVMMTSLQMILLVIVVSLLAGMIVFPAVFAFGLSPAEGPELTFVTLPTVFQQMFSPTLTSVSFFALMCMAAITSTISLMEVMVAFVREASEDTRRPLNRHQSVVIVTVIQIVTNTLCVLSLTGAVSGLTVMGQNLFDAANNFTTDVLIPLGAMGIAVIAGWIVPKQGNARSSVLAQIHLFTLRWIIPIAIIILFLESLNIL
jgi:NSS family neurotransmitter:Na+ symporter